MSAAYEGRSVSIWDRDMRWIVIQVNTLPDRPRLVLTIEEARELFEFLREYFTRYGD